MGLGLVLLVLFINDVCEDMLPPVWSLVDCCSFKTSVQRLLNTGFFKFNIESILLFEARLNFPGDFLAREATCFEESFD